MPSLPVANNAITRHTVADRSSSAPMPGKRGVVAACSYEARQFGVRSAMPIAEAQRRCPDAVFVRPQMDKYRTASRQVFAILADISPAVEKASIDEAYLDLTGLEKVAGPPEQIGQTLRRRIHEETGLTASVGIGPNRLIAKLGSEACKPDGLKLITPDQVDGFLAPMPVANLRGLGKRTLSKIERLNIRTVADLRDTPLDTLKQHLGDKAAESFHRQARGIASAEVVTDRQRKSISKETTFSQDVTDPDRLRDVLRELSAEVARTARRESLAGAVITLKIRYTGFETHTRQTTLAAPTHDERVISTSAWTLLQQGDLPDKPVRLIGAGLSGWADQAAVQTDLFSPAAPAGENDSILATIDTVTEKYGKPLLGMGLSRPRKNE